jgi:hypothetical protein
LYECETWSLKLREAHRLRVFENRVLRGIFGPKGDGVMGEWRNLHNGELHNLHSSLDIIRQIKSRLMRWGGGGMWQAWERGETCTGFWLESPKEKDHFKDLGVDGRMGSKWTLQRLVGGSGFTWLRIGIIGRLL